MARSSQRLVVEVCPEAERTQALKVLYRRTSSAMREAAVDALLRQAEGGGIELSGLWVGRRRGRIVAAMMTQELSGRAIALWPPEIADRLRATRTADRMISEALRASRARGFRIAQALIDPAAPRGAVAGLVRAGLSYITDLVYLERSTERDVPVRPATPSIHWRRYAAEREAAFNDVLHASYEDSLDMPELEAIRDPRDVLASHRANRRFHPDRWLIGQVEGEPRPTIVLLMAADPERSVWEVSYLGLAPEARGRGLGQAALAEAVRRARPSARRLELAVDARNRPARRLYERAGFRPLDRRSVFLASLSEPPHSPDRSRPPISPPWWRLSCPASWVRRLFG